MMPDYSLPFSLQAFHTFGLQAAARRVLGVASEVQLREAVAGCRTAGEPFFILGEGSNTVFTGDVHATVIRMDLMGRQWLEPSTDCHRLRVSAGENWHELVEWTLLEGKPGLENLALIPGSVGACPVQNIGAYGLEVMDRIESVRVLDLDSVQFRELSAVECRFSYRDSIFKHELAGKAIITAVTFALPSVWKPLASYADIAKWLAAAGIGEPSARDIFNAVVAVRTSKLPDPHVMGNAGSFFKNPIVCASEFEKLKAVWPDVVSYPQADGRFKLAAGWLIDRAGLKGFAIGGAAVSERQALVLVNRGGATADELKRLVAHVQSTVLSQFGVLLEPEPVMV
jgi:UDP-N-acetylmuramate dehydrogenase